ncbi:MAG: S8 family peptidase [Roseiflexaceae bacterium]
MNQIITPSPNPIAPTSTRIVLTDALQAMTVRTPESTPQQWYLDRIQAPILDNLAIPPVRVAIIDTGVDTTHPDLVNQIVETRNIFDESTMNDIQGHGTHTAGIIAATHNLTTNTRGICATCQIIAIKAINDDGYGSDVTVAQGIDNAINAGAKVINLSIGSIHDAPAIKAAIERALAADIIVVAAAGNNEKSPGEEVFPAAYPGVLAVSAVDQNNRIASFAQDNPGIDLVAPGVEIVSTSPHGDGYSIEQGTSTAAPQVTATAAIVRALRPELSAQQTQELILVHTEDLGNPGYDPIYGHGLLRVESVINAVQQADVTQKGYIRGRIIGADTLDITLELNKQPLPLDPNDQFRHVNLAAGSHTLDIIYADQRLPVTFDVTGIGLFVTDISIWVRNGTITPIVSEQLP